MNPALRLFHALPAPLKDLAATLHGMKLVGARYGIETPRLVAEARARERWSATDWGRWQAGALRETLTRAEALAASQGRSHGDPRRLESWPVLTKRQLRERPLDYLHPGRSRDRILERTSGSTGTPLQVWWSYAASRRWYALVEARLRGWHGVTRRDRWAILGGQLVAAPDRRRPPYWVWNAAMRQLYLSSYHLAPDTVASYLVELERRRVRSILGYPSALGALAAMALDQGLRGPRLEVVLCNAEPLSARQREQIGELFGCPVRDSYGLAELVAAASECEQGAMHLWPEVGVVELLDDDDQPVAPGETGRLVATGLLNEAMALVRYDTGDLAALDPDPAPCPCGRSLPRMLRLEGRQDDVLVTPDGRRVGRLDPAFKAELPIREAQIVQIAAAAVVVRVVPATGWGERHRDALRAALADRLGPAMVITVETVDALPRTAAGKLRAVVRELDDSAATEPSARGHCDG